MNEDLDHNDGRIQDAVCIKKERERHGERGKPIADGAIYKRREQSDPGKNDQTRVGGGHLWFPSYQQWAVRPASCAAARALRAAAPPLPCRLV
jgi:hypothetical protein